MIKNNKINSLFVNSIDLLDRLLFLELQKEIKEKEIKIKIGIFRLCYMILSILNSICIND